MLAPETIVHAHTSRVFTRLDATEAVLLHLGTKRYYTLNETGARLWELLQHGRCAREIARALQDDYVLTDAQAMTALGAFVEELQQEGLVSPMSPSAPCRRG
jgi:hypothetical protein